MRAAVRWSKGARKWRGQCPEAILASAPSVTGVKCMRSRRVAMWALAVAGSAAISAPAIAAERPLIPIAADTSTGRIVATFPAPGKDGVAGRYLYVAQIESGLGSAPL